MPYDLQLAKPLMLSKAYTQLPPPIVPNPNMDALLSSYIDAMIKSVQLTLKATKIVGSTVSGGTAPPGGTVVGALLTCPPPTVVQTPLISVYKPPQFSVQMPDGSTRYGEYTPWLRGATSVIDSVVNAAISSWLTAWVAAGLAVAYGGVAAWIPPAPPVPALPGPWTAGTVTPFLFDGIGGGTSTSPAPALVPKNALSKGSSTNVSISTGAGAPIVTPVVSMTAHSKDIFNAITGAFTALFGEMQKNVRVIDATGTGGSGTAAPGGIITGIMGPLTFDVT